MVKPAGAVKHKIDPRIVLLLAALGKSEVDAAKFMGLSVRQLRRRKSSDGQLYAAWKNGRQAFFSRKAKTKKQLDNPNPRLFKTARYISRKISENSDEVVNIFAEAIMNVYTDNFGSFDGVSNFEIAKKQIKYFLEKSNAQGNYKKLPDK